ncbi:MAG: glucan 1,4-alpha-maltotetraohydrolase domain-containing protein [Oligoflexus sp.]
MKHPGLFSLIASKAGKAKWGLALIMLSGISGASLTQAAKEQNQSSNAILFQGFHWNSANGNWYKNLQTKSRDLKNLGVTHVWFPPPSNSAARQGYLPRELNDLNSFYGTELELRSAIASLRDQGITSVADIVINHRVGSFGWGDFANPYWGCEAVVNDDEWPGACGGSPSGVNYHAARDIDHSQPGVQDSIKNWMKNRLQRVGFNGWRYDFSKGYSPFYARMYQEHTSSEFCVGEVWPNLDYNNVNAHRQQMIDYVDGTGGQCGAFDFTTKGLLNKALGDNEYWRLRDSSSRPAGAIGWWPQKMVTFVDNHDTGPSQSCVSGQNHWPVPCNKVMQGYAYILTHPGIPTVYYPHVYDWGLRDPIKALIDIRRQADLRSTSSISIQRAEDGIYAAIVQGGKGKVAMKIGPGDWNPGAGWTLASAGDQYAVWTQLAAVVKPDPVDPITCLTTAKFRIANADTAWGDGVYLVGNLAELGNWNPALGLALKIEGTGANAVWTGSIELPAGQAIEYKYVKWNGQRAIWEASGASGNREWVTSRSCGERIRQDDGNFRR